jgi:hypothetical protein
MNTSQGECPTPKKSTVPELNGFALQRAKLSGHEVEEMLPGFISLKAVGELLVKPSEFVDEICNIVSAQIEFRDRVEVFVTSWTRQHGLPPSLIICCVVWQALDKIANNKINKSRCRVTMSISC